MPGDRTEKKVNVIYKNNQILELGQLLTTSTCKISRKIASSINNRLAQCEPCGYVKLG